MNTTFMNQIMFRGFYLPSLHSVSLCVIPKRRGELSQEKHASLCQEFYNGAQNYFDLSSGPKITMQNRPLIHQLL